MQRFAARQLDQSGEPLFYLIEYEVREEGGIFFYEGEGYVINDVNKKITEADEAFTYSFERGGSDWSVIDNIKVTSKLGADIAEKIRNSFFNDLVLSGMMGHERRKN